MLDAVDDVFFLEVLDGPAYQSVDVRPPQPHRGLGPELLELELDLGEHELYGVQLALVFNIENRLYLEVLHALLGSFAGVDPEVVHEYAYAFARVPVPDHL